MENTITTKVTPGSTSEKAGVIGYGSGGNAIYGNTGSTTAITADKLKPVQPVVLPQKQTDTTPDQLSGFIASTTQSNKTQAQRELDMMNQQTQQVKDTTGRDLNATLQSILGTNTEIGNVESTVDRTEQDRALREYNNYTSQIEAEQLANRRAIESLQKNNPQGLFGGALQDEVARINRDSVSKQADLAILQNVSNRNYATAAQIADRQVEMKLKPLQTKLENLKFFYESNKSRFDKADDRLYANKIKEVDQEVNKLQKVEEQISQLKLNVAQYGGGASLLSKLSAIDTSSPKALDEAIKIAGRYASDPLDRAIKSAQLAKLRQTSSGGGGAEGVTATGAQASSSTEKSFDDINKLKTVLSNKAGITTSSGASRKRINPFIANKVNDWRANVNNILAQTTLAELARIKGTGVTFGALSEGERNAVGAASTALNAAMIYEGEGDSKVPTGRFKASEQFVKDNLALIQKYAELDFERRNGVTPSVYEKQKSINSTETYLDTVVNTLNNTNTDPYAQAGYYN